MSLLCLIVGFPAQAVLPPDGYPCRWETTAVLHCNVNKSALLWWIVGFGRKGTCRLMAIHVDGRQLLWWIVMLSNLLSWIVGFKRMDASRVMVSHVVR